MKKIINVFLVLFLASFIFSTSVSAAVSPTAEVIPSSVSVTYLNKGECGSIKTEVYKDENKIILKATVKKGYNFVQWEIPDIFELDENSSIEDEKIILYYEGTISKSDIKQISAQFKDKNDKKYFLTAISEKDNSNNNINNNPSPTSPITSDISYFNAQNCVLLLISCIISAFITIKMYKKKK